MSVYNTNYPRLKFISNRNLSQEKRIKIAFHIREFADTVVTTGNKEYENYSKKVRKPSPEGFIKYFYGLVCPRFNELMCRWQSRGYEQPLIFNKIWQVERSHAQLIQKKRVIYDLVKSRGRNFRDEFFEEPKIPRLFPGPSFSSINRGHCEYGPYLILVNSLSGDLEVEVPLTTELMGCITKTKDCFLLGATLEHRTTAESRSDIKMKGNKVDNNDADLGMGFSCSAPQNTLRHQPASSVVTSNTDRAVNKRSIAICKVTSRKTTVKAISKKQIKQELQESHQRWQDERDVIARIVQLDKKLGHAPTILDLYCAGFEPAEIAEISDLLQPLLVSDEEEVIPWASLEVVA